MSPKTTGISLTPRFGSVARDALKQYLYHYARMRASAREGKRLADDRPTAAFALSLIAGILILINGIFIAAIGAIIGAIFPGLGILFAVIGLVFGIIVLVGAIMMWSNPDQHVAWGVIVLLFSLFSIVIGGGFILGLILGLVGGILAIVWKPPVMMAPPWMPPMQPPYAPPMQPPYQPPSQPPGPPPSP